MFSHVIQLTSVSQDCTVKECTSYEIWINVRSRSSVLILSFPFHSGHSWHSNGCTTIGDAPAEIRDGRSFMRTRKSLLIRCTIKLYTVEVILAQIVKLLLDIDQVLIVPRRLCREVSMAARTVPVPLDRLRSQVDFNVKQLSNSMHNLSSYPKLISHIDT